VRISVIFVVYLSAVNIAYHLVRLDLNHTWKVASAVLSSLVCQLITSRQHGIDVDKIFKAYCSREMDRLCQQITIFSTLFRIYHKHSDHLITF